MRASKNLSLLAVAAPLAWMLSGCGGEAAPGAPPAPEVGFVLIKPEAVTLTTELPGRVSAIETSEVRPQVNGIVRERYFKEGAYVRQGQLLYKIDDAPYSAAFESAKGQLGRADAAIESTGLQAQRYADLAKVNAVSRQEADDARAAARQAQADVAAQRAAVRSAAINLGYTQVRAPISGRIGRSLFTAGTLVQNSQAEPLATIQRIDPVYVDMSQSAADLLTLRTEMAGGRVTGGGPSTARVSVQLQNGAAYPIEGTLQFAEVTVDASTGSVTLRATVPNPDGLLLPGMFVRAKIVEGVARDAIMAPASGVSRDEAGRPVVLVIGKDDKVEQRKVETSRLIGDRWLITSGLAAGDRLIVQGVEKAMPGATVKPRQVAEPQRAASARPAKG